MEFMKEYEGWLASDALLEEDKKELESIREDRKEIEERFYTELEFGTAGLRGIIRIGTNGMNGYVVRGRGIFTFSSIFLPAAGYGYDSYLRRTGSGGYYWSSTPGSVNSYYAWNLLFDSSNFFRGNVDRYYGQSVRPVRGFAE